MTEEQRNKISWLNRAFYAEKKAKALEEKLTRDRSLAERLSRTSETKSATSENGTETALIRLVQTQQQVQQQLLELENIRHEISRAIAGVQEDDLQAVLIYHYLNYFTFDRIAERMHYDRSTIFRKHISAVDKVNLENFKKCD